MPCPDRPTRRHSPRGDSDRLVRPVKIFAPLPTGVYSRSLITRPPREDAGGTAASADGDGGDGDGDDDDDDDDDDARPRTTRLRAGARGVATTPPPPPPRRRVVARCGEDEDARACDAARAVVATVAGIAVVSRGREYS